MLIGANIVTIITASIHAFDVIENPIQMGEVLFASGDQAMKA